VGAMLGTLTAEDVLWGFLGSAGFVLVIIGLVYLLVSSPKQWAYGLTTARFILYQPRVTGPDVFTIRLADMDDPPTILPSGDGTASIVLSQTAIAGEYPFQVDGVVGAEDVVRLIQDLRAGTGRPQPVSGRY